MPLARISDTHKIFKLPVFRGMGTLYQAMKLGIKALRFSTNAALDDPECARRRSARPELPTWAIAGPLLFSLVSFLFLYKFMPLLLVTRLAKIYPVLSGRLAFNLADGAIRIAIFLAFLYALSRMKDIRRMFQYHGAEHKVVFNFESGQPVNVANAQKFSTFHPRCGTSFLFVMMILAMPVYALHPVR